MDDIMKPRLPSSVMAGVLGSKFFEIYTLRDIMIATH